MTDTAKPTHMYKRPKGLQREYLMPKKHPEKHYPRQYWPKSSKTGRYICFSCREGYGSAIDGVCTKCRGKELHKMPESYIKECLERK